MILQAIKRSAFTAVLFSLFMYITIQSQSFSIQARLFPMIIGGIGVFLTGIQLLREFRESFVDVRAEAESGSNDQAGNTDFAITDSELTKEGRLRAVEQFVWIAGLLVGLWLLGFYVAVPLMVGLYTLREREPLKIVVPIVAGVALAIWGIFHELILLPFPKGLVFNALGF